MLRFATEWNTMAACNQATAGLIVSSPLLAGDYRPARPEFGDRSTEQFAGKGPAAGSPVVQSVAA